MCIVSHIIYSQRYMHPYIHCSIIYGSQDMKTTDRWLDKEDVVHIFNGILLSHKKSWNTAICNNMNRSWDYQAKWNKSNGKSQEPCDFTLMWDIKLKATNE